VGSQSKQAGISDVAIRADRKIFAAACWDGRVRVYEYKGSKGRALASLAYHGDVATSVAFSGMRDGGLLASSSRDGTVALWPIFPPTDRPPPPPPATAVHAPSSTGEEVEEI
jgi:WD40 repeat protein